jgi:hypothetical protein
MVIWTNNYGPWRWKTVDMFRTVQVSSIKQMKNYYMQVNVIILLRKIFFFIWYGMACV